MKAATGQIWASLDARDKARNERQERLVTAVRGGYAYLQSRPDAKGSYGVKLAHDGSIMRHRYVSAGLDPQRQHEAAQRADNLDREAEDLLKQADTLFAQADSIRRSWNLPA